MLTPWLYPYPMLVLPLLLVKEPAVSYSETTWGPRRPRPRRRQVPWDVVYRRLSLIALLRREDVRSYWAAVGVPWQARSKRKGDCAPDLLVLRLAKVVGLSWGMFVGPEPQFVAAIGHVVGDSCIDEGD